MKITHIRNATVIIQTGEYVILVDPMLAPKNAIPALKYGTRRKRRNPLVELPRITDSLLKKVTHCLITHCQKGHFDHLDRRAVAWLREHNIPIFCELSDAAFLRKKGLSVVALRKDNKNPFLNGTVSLVPCLHGKGLIGKLMAHGVGYFIKQQNEPSLYLSGDTILTPEISNFIHINQPDIVLIPAGGAKFDVGAEVIMGIEDAKRIGEITSGHVIANHLEALDHCPVSRDELNALIREHAWGKRYIVPLDGETLEFSQTT